MVKRRSSLVSTEAFQVRILVGVLERWWPWCSGFCTSGCGPEGEGSTPSGDPGSVYRSVLLGEQPASNPGPQGSNPCTPAFIGHQGGNPPQASGPPPRPRAPAAAPAPRP